MPLPGREEIATALAIVRAHVPPTPTFRWPLLERRLGAVVHVKHENHTALGAFKLRGGAVYMHELVRREPGVRGVVSATRGNHGQSIARAAALHGTAWARPSSCPVATRWRRTRRCVPLARR
jgi:threonine dehydratase